MVVKVRNQGRHEYGQRCGVQCLVVQIQRVVVPGGRDRKIGTMGNCIGHGRHIGLLRMHDGKSAIRRSSRAVVRFAKDWRDRG